MKKKKKNNNILRLQISETTEKRSTLADMILDQLSFVSEDYAWRMACIPHAVLHKHICSPQGLIYVHHTQIAQRHWFKQTPHHMGWWRKYNSVMWTSKHLKIIVLLIVINLFNQLVINEPIPTPWVYGWNDILVVSFG